MSDFRAKFELLGYDVGAVERAAVTKASEFSIHSPESIRFMKQVVGASNNVLSLLENGLTPAVNVPNPPYTEENNLSACQDSLVAVLTESLITYQVFLEGGFLKIVLFYFCAP